jgi:hypothetical protein
MISKSQKINSKIPRNMLTWSHFRFRTRLINKTREHPNCKVMGTLAKLAVNVDFFTTRLEAQRSSDVHNVTKNLIETLILLGIFY